MSKSHSARELKLVGALKPAAPDFGLRPPITLCSCSNITRALDWPEHDLGSRSRSARLFRLRFAPRNAKPNERERSSGSNGGISWALVMPISWRSQGFEIETNEQLFRCPRPFKSRKRIDDNRL